MGGRLYVVVPCYNEEEVIDETAERLLKKLAELIKAGKVSEQSRILFVDDGSKDTTWVKIRSLCEKTKFFAGVSLSHNSGHQNALFCGLIEARTYADLTISIDADLQDDIGAIDKMVDEYIAGSDIVYGVRSLREKDTFFKRFTAESYYKLLKALGVDVVFNHADYRLMSARALDALSQYGESDLFLRGIVPRLGFRTSTVAYERGERFAGESKYPLGKMLKLASDGAYSNSMKLIRIISAIGAFVVLASFIMLLAQLIGLAFGNPFSGWEVVLVSLWFSTGLVLFALGTVGEYAGRAYMEAKKRPRYIVGETVGLQPDQVQEQSGDRH